MDKKTKIKWIKALRSRRYEQGRFVLRSGHQFCCLGVLADIKGAKWINGKPYINGKPVSSVDAALLHPSFAGLCRNTQNNLAAMNDGRARPHHTFKQIADYIEKRIGPR